MIKHKFVLTAGVLVASTLFATGGSPSQQKAPQHISLRDFICASPHAWRVSVVENPDVMREAFITDNRNRWLQAGYSSAVVEKMCAQVRKKVYENPEPQALLSQVVGRYAKSIN